MCVCDVQFRGLAAYVQIVRDTTLRTDSRRHTTIVIDPYTEE